MDKKEFNEMVAFDFSDLNMKQKGNDNCFTASSCDIGGFCNCDNPCDCDCDTKCDCDNCDNLCDND